MRVLTTAGLLTSPIKPGNERLNFQSTIQFQEPKRIGLGLRTLNPKP